MACFQFTRNFLFVFYLLFCVVASFIAYYNFRHLSNQEFFDVKPLSEHISYIYAPGMMGTELMMGRYCPEFTASTGEKITWKSGGHVIGQPHSAVIFPELDLRKPTTWSWNPLTLMVNGLRKDLFPLIQRKFQDCYQFTVVDNLASLTSVANFTFSFSKANIGQKKDIQALYNTYNQHNERHPGTNIILYGDSRGSATIFNFLALYKPSNVKAAILDGIFDEVPHCIKHFLYEDKDLRIEERLHNFMAFFMRSYNKKGPFPLQYAQHMTTSIPLLLVTSLKDGLTPPQGAIKLYLTLKELGHTKVHLLILKDSLHPCYMIDNPHDRKCYETTVHAFYKQYHLPYNRKLAQQGHKYFEKTQPTTQELKNYNLPTCTLCAL